MPGKTAAQPPPPPPRGCWHALPAKKKIIIIIITAITIMCVALGIGIGFGVKFLENADGDQSENNNNNTPPPPSPSPSPNTTTPPPPPSPIWQPPINATWQIELHHPLNFTDSSTTTTTTASKNASIYTLDLFTTPNTTITTLHQQNRKVICHFSAGTYQSSTPDKHLFHLPDLGNTLNNHQPDEKYLSTTSPSVRRIMHSRIALAVDKGCDGIDPDHVDAYAHSNGLGLSRDDAVDYVDWMASVAHGRNLSVGLREAPDVVPSLVNRVEWGVSVGCVERGDCGRFLAFAGAGKPVFHVEFTKSDVHDDDDDDDGDEALTKERERVCGYDGIGDFSTIFKNRDLDDWVGTC